MGHKQRYAARVDENQKAIVDELRSRGVSVVLGMDDILCGHRSRTYWFEIKDPAKCFLADGVTYKSGAIKKKQTEIRKTFRGHYSIVTTIEQILRQMGIEQ